MAHVFAYGAATHQHKHVEAGDLLEICLEYSRHAPPTLREALMSEAAFFQARRRKRVDLAEQWLADIPATTALPWLRTSAEGAILQARGDLHGAAAKLDECEKAIIALPNAVQRKYLLVLMQRWRSELLGVTQRSRLVLRGVHAASYLIRGPFVGAMGFLPSSDRDSAEADVLCLHA